MKVFQVVEVLLRLFRMGKMRIQRGPGARGLYLLEKWKPLRYTTRDRMIAYRRAFNYGVAEVPAGAIVNRNFHRLLVGFMVALAQYFRDLLIGEVIRGGPLIEQRPFGSIGTVQRIGLDLRYALDRATYGNISALAMETGHYLKSVLQLLDAPDIKKSFDANTKGGRCRDRVEPLPGRYRGAFATREDGEERADDSAVRGRQRLQDGDRSDPVPVDGASNGRAFEAWVAAYRMTPEGRGFAGITPALRSVLSASSAAVA